jgi:hypothetical protein
MCNSSQLGFNYDFIRGDCNADQFCRSNVCLCLPNYTETHSGDCTHPHYNGMSFRFVKEHNICSL